MGIGKGLGKFAEGLANGYAQGLANRRQQEEHDLRMEQARNDKEMRAEIKRLSDTKAAPAEAFVVKGEDGTSTVYTDAAMAHDAAGAGGQVHKKIVVAGKQYDSPEEANVAVETANSPLMKMRQAAEIAAKYSNPAMAEMYMKQYEMGVKMNKQDAIETMQNAINSGDPKAVLDVYNKRLLNGRTAELQVDEATGKLAVQVMAGGKPVGKPEVYDDTAAFFKATQERVLNTSENAFAMWQHKNQLAMEDKKFGLQAMQVASSVRANDAGIKKTEAEIAQMPEEMKVRKMGAQAALTSAGASATNADTQRIGLFQPKTISGVDENDNVTLTSVAPTYDRKTGWGGLNVGKPQVVPGMLPTGMAKPQSAMDAMMLGGGMGAPKTAEDYINQLNTALPPKKIGPAPTK